MIFSLEEIIATWLLYEEARENQEVKRKGIEFSVVKTGRGRRRRMYRVTCLFAVPRASPPRFGMLACLSLVSTRIHPCLVARSYIHVGAYKHIIYIRAYTYIDI